MKISDKTAMKISGLVLFAGAAQFFLLVLIAEALYPHYSVANNYISDLGVGSTAYIFNTSIVLLGIDAGIIMFIGSLLILGFPHGSIYPTASYYIASSVELEDLNVVYSVFILIMDIIIFLIPFVFGIISTIYSIRIAIYLTAVPMVLLLLTSVFFNIKDNKAIKKTPVTQ